ncbi:hypothetical protein [Lactobacillus corticis]|uniref:Uncharacterized protein n=1 Tax=Lactobacillus corticis TaxID=2201249 RepID=A0A916QJS8_9LACO|nr:hypothetical protein [Lactobacillus corticis]GFZ26620.1 hypothetical protein LCB40_05000 [Lactobacillus corticis]
MMFLYCKVIDDNAKQRRLKLESDVETATATIDKKTWNVKIDGFKDSLKYIYPKGFVEKFIVSNTQKNPNEMSFAYGRG